MITKQCLVGFLAIVAIILCAPISSAADFYKWVDDQGSTHYADTLLGVPEEYRDQLEEGEFKKNTPKSTVRGLSGGSSSSVPQKGDNKGSKKLRRIEIKYKAYEGGARRIIIPVTFNGSVTVPMLLDTGAPGLVISPALADKLGVFDSDDGKMLWATGGIGGSVPAIITIINSAKIGGARDEFIPAIITPSISGSFYGLIGMDFMANFSIAIDTRRHVLILQEQGKRPNMRGGHDRTWWKINFRQFASMRASWKQYGESVKGKSKEQAQKQYKEANKLFNRLENYANHKSVPMSWRKY